MDRILDGQDHIPHLTRSIEFDMSGTSGPIPSESLREARPASDYASKTPSINDTTGLSALTHEEAGIGSLSSQKASTLRSWGKPLSNTRWAKGVRIQPVEESPSRLHHDERYNWLPVTLHLPYLIALFAFSFAFGVVALSITIYSHVHTGLGNDNGSAAVFFGWRFAPTVVAVIYGVLVGTLMQDIRRTEVFARLSASVPTSASSTLLFPLRAWWNDIVDGLSKSKNNGSRSWALVLASAVNVLSLLVISPLSAAFLAPQNVELAQETAFTRLGLESLHEVRTDNADALMFRTISGGLLNASTSAWIKNSHFISPFWPDSLSSPPLTSSFGLEPQKWVGETTVYRAAMDCSVLSLVDVSNTTAYELYPELAEDDTNVNWPIRGFKLESDDGCTINVFDLDPDEYSDDIWGRGGGWWVKNASELDRKFVNSDIYMSNSSGTCGDRTFLFATTGWNSSNVAATTGALCTAQYFEANVPVTVLVNQSATTITFDLEEFGLKESIMGSDSTSNITDGIRDGLFAVVWSQKFQLTYVARNLPIYLGPMCALTASPMHEYDARKIVEDPHLLDQALQLYQQWFGQMFVSSVDPSMLSTPGTDFKAQVLVDRRRIVAVFAIGLVIGILLLLSSLSILLVMLLSRTHRRPLNLNYEPANVGVIASLVTDSTDIQKLFAGLDRSNTDEIKTRLKERHFNLSNGTISVEPLSTADVSLITKPKKRSRLSVFSRFAKFPKKSRVSSEPKKRNPTPLLFRTWMGTLLAMVMLGLLAALIALYELSITKGLSSNVLTYELSFTIADKASKFAPYSIAPVVIAVALKLWYGAVDETLRRHQVFYETTRQPVPLRQSLLTEYANTPLFLTSIKAVSNRHWILFLVGLGATAAEICKSNTAWMQPEADHHCSHDRNVCSVGSPDSLSYVSC